MRFLVLAYGDKDKVSALSRDEMRALGEKCNAYDAELQKTGRLVGSASLDWPSKRMRLERGKLTVTDGPFLESKELVGGLVIIEADDFDEAVRLASLHPAARMGEELGWGIELRPIGFCQLKAIANES